MAKESVPTPPAKRKFAKLTRPFAVRGGVRRDPAAITVEPTGRAECNTQAGAELQWLVERKQVSENQFWITIGIDDQNGEVALYVEQDRVDGAILVRKTGKRYVIHLGGVFEAYPTLRPTGLLLCPVQRDVDADGHDCLQISVAGGVAKRKTGRKESIPAAQVAATAQ